MKRVESKTKGNEIPFEKDSYSTRCSDINPNNNLQRVVCPKLTT